MRASGISGRGPHGQHRSRGKPKQPVGRRIGKRTSAIGAPKSQDRDGERAALGYAKPRTYEELRAVLSSGTIHFPKRLRQVAIFLWQHPSDVALGTISQVAEQAGVQPSTLVRFAQIFGYAGFSDFQGLFKEHVKGSWPEGRAGNDVQERRRDRKRQSAFSSTASSPPRRPRSAASTTASTSPVSRG